MLELGAYEDYALFLVFAYSYKLFLFSSSYFSLIKFSCLCLEINIFIGSVLLKPNLYAILSVYVDFSLYFINSFDSKLVVYVSSNSFLKSSSGKYC